MENKPLQYVLLIFLPIVGIIVGMAVAIWVLDLPTDNEITTFTNTVPSSNNVNTNVNVNTNSNTNTAPVVEDPLKITVDWSPDALQVNVVRDLGLTLPEDETDEGRFTASDAFKAYYVGDVTSNNFKGRRVLLITRGCYGPCGISHYRVIDDRGGKGLIRLANLSNDAYSSDERQFFNTSEYDIPDLHLPDTMSLDYNGKKLTFLEDYSPSTLLTDISYLSLRPFADHPTYGPMYEDTENGNFYVKNPDHTVKLYRLDFPFDEGNVDYGRGSRGSSLVLDPKSSASFTASYTPATAFPCGPVHYDIHTGIDDGLTEGGTINGTLTYYNAKSSTDKLYTDAYSWYALPGESYDSRSETLQEFVANHAVIFWKDELGRWFRLLKTEYQPLAEMGCGMLESPL